jgi:ankyrin repeat protein
MASTAPPAASASSASAPPAAAAVAAAGGGGGGGFNFSFPAAPAAVTTTAAAAAAGAVASASPPPTLPALGGFSPAPFAWAAVPSPTAAPLPTAAAPGAATAPIVSGSSPPFTFGGSGAAAVAPLAAFGGASSAPFAFGKATSKARPAALHVNPAASHARSAAGAPTPSSALASESALGEAQMRAALGAAQRPTAAPARAQEASGGVGGDAGGGTGSGGGGGHGAGGGGGSGGSAGSAFATVVAARPVDASPRSECACVAAASAAERVACEARFAAASAAAAAAGAPAPFRGPAADSRLGERFLDVIALVSANGFALDARPARYLCGLTLREGMRRADGSLDRAGFRGGPADMIRRALEAQAPWLTAARAAPREDAWLHGALIARTRTTSLIRAAAAGDERRVRELLAASAPLRCVDDQRSTALHHASTRRQRSTQLVVALLEADAAGVMLDEQNSEGNTALIHASENGHEDAVRLLLKRGARQGLQNKLGMAALHCAAWKGHADVVKLLCAAPGAAAALSLRTMVGDTPLARAVAARSCSERLVAALLAADAEGATVNAQNDYGNTALIESSREGNDCAVRLLLARGARQELQNEGGWTALHFAASEGHADIVEQLCAAPGASTALALRNKDGYTPLVFAVSSYSLGSERLFGFGQLEAGVKALLAADAAGVTVNAQVKSGTTALARASYEGHEGVVRLLLARGARQELQNKNGMAALHFAAMRGHVGVVEQLCAAPGAAAAIALRDKGGYTPLARAVRAGHDACASALRAHGAS